MGRSCPEDEACSEGHDEAQTCSYPWGNQPWMTPSTCRMPCQWVASCPLTCSVWILQIPPDLSLSFILYFQSITKSIDYSFKFLLFPISPTTFQHKLPLSALDHCHPGDCPTYLAPSTFPCISSQQPDWTLHTMSSMARTEVDLDTCAMKVQLTFTLGPFSPGSRSPRARVSMSQCSLGSSGDAWFVPVLHYH